MNHTYVRVHVYRQRERKKERQSFLTVVQEENLPLPPLFPLSSPKSSHSLSFFLLSSPFPTQQWIYVYLTLQFLSLLQHSLPRKTMAQLRGASHWGRLTCMVVNLQGQYEGDLNLLPCAVSSPCPPCKSHILIPSPSPSLLLGMPFPRQWQGIPWPVACCWPAGCWEIPQPQQWWPAAAPFLPLCKI